jgi:hypothetical protein
MSLQLIDMMEWLVDYCIDFALVSGDVGHPLHDTMWQKLYYLLSKVK